METFIYLLIFFALGLVVYAVVFQGILFKIIRDRRRASKKTRDKYGF